MTVRAETWLELIEREYLADFIAAGGGAVRFVVAAEAGLEQVSTELQARAAGCGMVPVAVDLAVTRLHMLHSVVFAIADALPWDGLLQARLQALVADAGYRWPQGGQAMRLPAIAEANGVAPPLLQRALDQALTTGVWHDARLTQDFRTGMMALLGARLGGDNQLTADAVLQWLCGRLGSLAPLRRAGIAQRIGRQNARASLMSLCHWVRRCGGAGILLELDIRRLHRERREVAEGLYYTPAAVMDCYEVLRQLIDEAEQFPGLFVAVLADEALLSEDPRRSLGQYTALQMRIANEVRPREGDNPLAPLVRLAA